MSSLTNEPDVASLFLAATLGALATASKDGRGAERPVFHDGRIFTEKHGERTHVKNRKVIDRDGLTGKAFRRAEKSARRAAKILDVRTQTEHPKLARDARHAAVEVRRGQPERIETIVTDGGEDL